MKKLDKKAQMQNTMGPVIGLIAGVGVAVLAFIFVSVLGGQTYQLVESDLDTIGDGGVSVVDEAVTLLLPADAVGGVVQLTYGELAALTSVVNGATTLILTTDYTVSLPLGQITLVNATYNDTEANVTYTAANYSVRDPIKNSIIASFEALESTGSYLPLIVLALILVLVLGIVLSLTGAFSGGTGGRGQVL